MRALLLAAALASPAAALHPQVVSPGLAMLSDFDVAGLGGEAERLRRWAAGKSDLALTGDAVSAGGEAFTLSPALATALRRMDSYFGMTPATLAKPVTLDELKMSLLSPEGVAQVEALFLKAMEASVSAGGKFVVPELGGDAVHEGKVHFSVTANPLRPLLDQLAARRDDPAALRRLFQEQPDLMSRLDSLGTLRKHLETRERWDREDKVPLDRRVGLLRSVIDDLLMITGGQYLASPKAGIEAMISRDWNGRYVSPWHLHPPDQGPSGWVEPPPPSPEDVDAARRVGRELVLVFALDGFDVYDLDMTRGGVQYGSNADFSFRSPSWRARFAAVHDRLAGAAR